MTGLYICVKFIMISEVVSNLQSRHQVEMALFIIYYVQRE